MHCGLSISVNPTPKALWGQYLQEVVFIDIFLVMKYEDMLKRVKNLEFDKEMPVYQAEGVELFILRPSKLSKRFKNYDIKRNFQIWLRYKERSFRPNHLRTMIDLNLRSRSRPDLKLALLTIFDNIFYGSDPNKEIKKLKSEEFEHFLNPLEIIANLSQLFIVEQNYNYNKESKFNPPSLFYQGWLRQAIDDTREIDNLCMSVGKGLQHPPVKYTALENRKNKKFKENLKPLWYLD